MLVTAWQDRAVETVTRLFTPADAPALTGLLHRASGGRCWVSVDGERLVATLTISLPPGRMVAGLTAYAAEPGRAWLNQKV